MKMKIECTEVEKQKLVRIMRENLKCFICPLEQGCHLTNCQQRIEDNIEWIIK